MKILSVNVGQPRTITHNGQETTTGIFKSPVAGPIPIRGHNLDGDGQADLDSHGGPNKAVYAYPHEHYAHWAQTIRRTDLSFGQFGENLTVTGLLEDQIHIGDTYRFGTALLQVAQPRMPCFKLGLRMEMKKFPQIFMHSGRTGFYWRVVEEGQIQAGDPIKPVQTNASQFTVRRIWEMGFVEPGEPEEMRRALTLTSLGREWRQPLARHLLALGLGDQEKSPPS
ncbi:MAG: MOSC domain-containing protein [Candidatus Latescibacteria bacterium]|nr:MOSC domain-containing protein [Candidatus Latescibacterota bacterium]